MTGATASAKRHILAPDGNYYAWDNTVSINRARKDLRALARPGRPDICPGKLAVAVYLNFTMKRGLNK